MKKVVISILMLVLISACGTNQLDDYSEGRLNKNELVLVETKNDGLLELIVDELLFGWITPNYDVELSVKIDTVDGIRTGVDFLRDSQRFAIEPGNHEFEVSCEVRITHKDNEDRYENSDKINLKIMSGYQYTIYTVKDGSNCKIEIVESKV